MAGRNKTPTALKIVKGTDQPCRTNTAEPKPEIGIPVCPDHLPVEVKESWRAIGEMLVSTGVLAVTDGLSMEGLCCTVVELRAARTSLMVHGGGLLTYECKTEGGATMYRPYPEVTMIADLDRRFIAWLSKFGLTPADRSKVSTLVKDNNNDPWGQF